MIVGDSWDNDGIVGTGITHLYFFQVSSLMSAIIMYCYQSICKIIIPLALWKSWKK